MLRHLKKIRQKFAPDVPNRIPKPASVSGLGGKIITPRIAEMIIVKNCPMATNMIPGKLYFVKEYQAKLAEKLEIWDSDPLIYVFDYTEGLDGPNIQGASLHFLPESRRMDIINGGRLSWTEEYDAFKEYIPERIPIAFEIPPAYIPIAIKTEGRFNRRKKSRK